jgi:ribosomal protein L37AE/L43A
VKNITMEKEQLYVCEKCDYSTSRKFNYLKHIETEKHKSPLHVMSTKMSTFQDPPPTTYRCPNCDRKYMAQRSLWRHSKQCSSDNIDKSAYNVFSAKIAELCQSNAELSKTNQIQQTQMIQLCTAVLTTIGQNLIVSQSATGQNASSALSSGHNYTTYSLPMCLAQSQPATLSNINNNMTTNHVTVNGNMTNNSNNKTFNINMFLNEECKDAMNMTDFVKTIELDTDDMEDVGKRGFVKGISKIFIDNLEKTEVTKRPIHCSDARRDVLYIKDDNKWEREGIHSKKLLDAIHTVEHKNVILVNEWAKTHPQCENSETQANQIYMTLSKHATDGDDENITKVAKQIAKSVIIDKNDLS